MKKNEETVWVIHPDARGAIGVLVCAVLIVVGGICYYFFG